MYAVSKASRPSKGLTQRLTECISRLLSYAEVKNEFSYTAIPLCLHVVQRGNIVFNKCCDTCILSDIDSGERGIRQAV